MLCSGVAQTSYPIWMSLNVLYFDLYFIKWYYLLGILSDSCKTLVTRWNTLRSWDWGCVPHGRQLPAALLSSSLCLRRQCFCRKLPVKSVQSETDFQGSIASQHYVVAKIQSWLASLTAQFICCWYTVNALIEAGAFIWLKQIAAFIGSRPLLETGLYFDLSKTGYQ